MKLEYIPLDKLSVSKANMRDGRKPPDISDLLPTVRARGILQSLIVRPNCTVGCYEIVAGRRRFHAALAVAEESGHAEPVPCAILDDGDDATALEASLIENIARLDPDEVNQWETFTRLIKEGRTPDDIATTFGLPELTVRRVLALGNLLPRIRALYARDEIDRVTVRHLTMASKRQQQDWLACWDDPERHAPIGHGLKPWLFGGQSIPARNALFGVETSGVATVADLFGEDVYFSDIAAFWTAQNAAIDQRRDAYLADGWGQVVVVPPTEHFHTWEYDKTPKRKGGRVYIDVRANGEVSVHEGYVSRQEASRAAKAQAIGRDKPARPEVTAAMQTYLDLHRHAATRAALTAFPQAALRLLVAHVIAGSHLVRVQPEPQACRDDATRESVENSLGEAAFDEQRRAVLALLDFGEDEPTMIGAGRYLDAPDLFVRLLALSDDQVLQVVAVVIGECLASGSDAVAAVGVWIGVPMADYWQADAAFFDLLRDKEVLVAMVGEVAGETVASANKSEKGKTLKTIIANHLDGAEGRPKVDGWVPKWMAFPPEAYTERGGVGTVAAHARLTWTRDEHAPEPVAPNATGLSPEPDEDRDDGGDDGGFVAPEALAA